MASPAPAPGESLRCDNGNSMQNHPIKYLHLKPDEALPALDGLSTFKAIVVIEAESSQLWQWDVCRWLVASGCRYMLAWGRDCASWEEAVDDASLERFDYEDVPQDQSVLTTSHEDEELGEAFWFARHRAHHPALALQDTLIVHIAAEARQEELERLHEDA